MEEKHQEMQCRLPAMEKNNEGLRVMFDEALKRSTKLQKEVKEWKLQNTEKKNEGLQVMKH